MQVESPSFRNKNTESVKKGFEVSERTLVKSEQDAHNDKLDKNLLMSPGAMQDVATKPRQIRKEATVCRLQLCRRLPGLFKRFFYL